MNSIQKIGKVKSNNFASGGLRVKTSIVGLKRRSNAQSRSTESPQAPIFVGHPVFGRQRSIMQTLVAPWIAPITSVNASSPEGRDRAYRARPGPPDPPARPLQAHPFEANPAPAHPSQSRKTPSTSFGAPLGPPSPAGLPSRQDPGQPGPRPTTDHTRLREQIETLVAQRIEDFLLSCGGRLPDLAGRCGRSNKDNHRQFIFHALHLCHQ